MLLNLSQISRHIGSSKFWDNDNHKLSRQIDRNWNFLNFIYLAGRSTARHNRRESSRELTNRKIRKITDYAARICSKQSFPGQSHTQPSTTLWYSLFTTLLCIFFSPFFHNSQIPCSNHHMPSIHSVVFSALFYPIPHSLAPFTHYISFLAIPLTHFPPLINIQAFSVVRLILLQLQHLLTPSIHRDQWSIRDP